MKATVEKLLTKNAKLAQDLLLLIPYEHYNEGCVASYAGLIKRISQTRYYKYNWKSVWRLMEETNIIMAIYEALFQHKTLQELNSIYRKFIDFDSKFWGCTHEYGDIILTTLDNNHMSFRCHRLLCRHY